MEIPKREIAVDRTGRLNIQYNGSDLYDSFELQEMTYQINKAIQSSDASSPAYQDMTYQLQKAIRGSSVSSPAYVFHLHSPFYHRRLNRIYRESAKTPKKVSGLQAPDKRAGRRGTKGRGFITRLWIRVKQGLLGNNQESEEGRP